MGVIAICLLSLKGDIGCVVKTSFVSYQRITSILQQFNSTIEDIRISCRNASNSVLGGKRIDDIYPIAEPIPMVIGAYRLLYLLINDIYIITIDIDRHSPFLALDVLEKVKDVIYASMNGNVAFSEVERNKISFYYAFRRCINGMEGVSVLNIPLRQIRLANDPLTVYTTNNELLDINDCLNSNEIPAEIRDYRRDAWEAVLHLEGRIPAEVKKEMKSNIIAEKFDDFFDVTAELPYHQVPETVTTPMVDLIVDEAFDAEQVTEPLTRLRQDLERTQTTDTQFMLAAIEEVKSAAQASCTPPDLQTPKVTETVVEHTVDEEEADEMIVPEDEQIRVAVPGKTMPQNTNTTPAPAAEEEEEEGNDEALAVVSIDGSLSETLRIEENPESIVKQILKGELKIKPECPDGIKEGNTALRITFSNATAYEFTPADGMCHVVEDKGDVKTFEITVPAKTPTEAISVLTYKGPIPEGQVPCSAKCRSSREGTATSVMIEAHCNSVPSAIEGLTCFAMPPLLTNDTAIKRTFRFKPKGGFLKTSLKCRWTDQFMEEGNDYTFGAEITEPVGLENLPESRDAEYCPCELKGKFNGYVSGVRIEFHTEPDANLGCSYQKREILAASSFVHAFNP